MKKSIWKSIIVVMIITILFITLPIGCISANRAMLTRQITIALNNYLEGEARSINIANIRYSQWDKVYIFGSYSICEKVVDVIGAQYYKYPCELSGIGDSENLALFVFMKKGLVVGDSVVRGIEVREVDHNGYTQDEAYFVLNDYGFLTRDSNQ